MREHTNRNTLLPLDRSALDAAKARVSIASAWRALGLPGEPGRVCCSPFRNDRHPSFSISGDGLWHDFATGEGGDVVSFVMRATGCTNSVAIRRVLDLAGGIVSTVPLVPLQCSAKAVCAPWDGLSRLNLQMPTLAEVHTLTGQRTWLFNDGIEIAIRRGMLRIADVDHHGETHRAWICTDNSRKSGQARRLDGEPWQTDGTKFKSKSLRTDPDHPPGLADVVNADRRAALLAEGEIDAFAGLTFIWLADLTDEVGVIALTGAGKDLPPAVLEKLKGRRVRILRQTDNAGHRCALKWAESLTAAGVACDLANLDGISRADGLPAKDAADLLCRPADLDDLVPLATHLLSGLLE